MFFYSITMGNPGGTDWVVEVSHEKEFTEQEFSEIVENALVSALETTYEKEGFSSVTTITSKQIIPHLVKQGFILPPELTQHYFFQPFWSTNTIKNDYLNQWISKSSRDPVPEYMKKDTPQIEE